MLTKHPAFKALSRATNTIFRERGSHFWLPYDSENQLPISLIFNDTYAEIDASGIRVEEGKPTAFILFSDAITLHPARAFLDKDIIFSNKDIIKINDKDFGIESCRFDGYHYLEVKLFEKK